jgi:hypothetical protein
MKVVANLFVLVLMVIQSFVSRDSSVCLGDYKFLTTQFKSSATDVPSQSASQSQEIANDLDLSCANFRKPLRESARQSPD